MAEKQKPRKPIFQTASPFRPPKITQLAQPYHEVVVDLLVSVLSPIGQYRQNLPKPTTTTHKKRKRKRKPCKSVEKIDQKPDSIEENSKQDADPGPPPEIMDYCLIGFNAVTRHLEELSRFSSKQASKEDKKPRHISMVFLLRPMDDLIYSHFPMLCQTASLAYPDLSPTRLILLDPSVEPKITEVVAQIRGVSVLAIAENPEDAGNTSALTEYVRRNVEVVGVPWLKQIAEGKWLGTAIEAQ